MTNPPDPIEQLAAELRELWQDSDLPSSELVAKLIKVAIKAVEDGCWTRWTDTPVSGDRLVVEFPTEADICQRIREGMGK